jgi:hypothetical protein
MGWTIEDFKSTSLEVGQWCWGTMQGAFNEKQTISQVIVDAVIGMIPLLGDATAVRDLLAVGIGMSDDPPKRREVMQWVLLVILLFALIPVVGGVIKGVGRLALRVTGDVAKDSELLAEIIRFLNRMGHGDAQKWLKTLDLGQYQTQILNKCKDFCATVQLAIKKALDARVGRALPDVWRAKLERVRQGFFDLQDLADTMIPQAFKELNARLRTLQNMVYRGEVHEIATGGMPKVKREAEAYLEERKLAREIKRGRYVASDCIAEAESGDAIRAIYQPKIDAGWPDILRFKTTENPAFKGTSIFQTVASFHGEIRAIGASELAGKSMFRVFGNASGSVRDTFAGGMFWGMGVAPKSAKEWRTRAAVLDEWNANGFIAILHFPPDLSERVPTAKAWLGQIAEQYGDVIPSQYLEGGGEQLFMDLGELSQLITARGNSLKAGEAVAPLEWNGIQVEFRATNWSDVSGVYGYGEREAAADAARTRTLGSEEIQAKTSSARSPSRADEVSEESKQ